MKTLIAIAAVSLAASGASAQSWTGNTTGKPTYNRSLVGFSGLSAVGTAVRYEVFQFTVTQNGSYTFQNTATGGWDNFTFLYQNAFNPGSPLLNGIASNDDNPGIGLSGFSIALTAGTQYFYVATGFANTDFGAYRVDVSSTSGGQVVLVPAPGAAALMGMGMLVAGRRRR
ncbi:MAG: PEP-CTERM sorting domain-containing protein [Planctomycetes bacterium]|nr:PEP-CTERM sorting domain-containing protein [Planctomycetota bacterium]